MAQHYSDLLDSESFRLATISQEDHPNPTDTETKIPSVTLTTHRLSGAADTAYNALSYTWGSSRGGTAEDVEGCPIILNGHIFEAKPNLYNALLELYTACSDTPIWIDALCINQSNADERSTQVSLMNQIYGNATRVIVWLGKPFPELEAGLKAAERIYTQSVPHTLRMIGTQTWDFNLDLSSMPERYNMEPIDRDEALGLVTVFMSNWFARMWVIQEVSLASDVVILCNQKFTPFDCVGLAATFLHYSGFVVPVLRFIPKDKPGIYFQQNINFYQAERVQLLREWCKGEKSTWAGVLSMIDFEAGLGEQQSSSSLLLLRLLVSTFGFGTTDPRDTIYGLGGILKHMAAAQGHELPPVFLPNYKIEAKDLLRDVAQEIFEQTDSLALLSLVKDPSWRQTPGLPSWAPDFPPEMCNSVLGPGFKSVGIINSSKYIPKGTNKYPFRIDGKTLNAFGFRLGTVQKVAELYIEGVQGHFEKMVDMLLSMDKVYPYTNQSSDEALWRTLIWDTDFTYRPARLVRTEDFQKAILEHIMVSLRVHFKDHESKSVAQGLVSSSIQRMDYLNEVAAKFPNSIFPDVRLLKSVCVKIGFLPREEGEDLLDDEELQALENPFPEKTMPPGNIMASTWYQKRPFLTDTGYLGMGLVSTQARDEVWIISGCPAPVILRKTDKEANEYSLIGESYVHGVMQGEAITDDVLWQKVQIV
ncbi:hypothetical protein FSARC_4759 [Fusarium sarcochroum]|uniref:Heterokaryon incompatibility domain-containing protein n=1 Tax=Fusarium sarcochroum TaxID=1208366 RepID=A0A8H4XB51_9HYPO|nr:hypothetical protein FSARC_4759 [Fusarium sarcochroum]